MDDINLIKSFFNSNTKKYGNSYKSLDWGSQRTQLIRFAVLSEIGELNNCSILDLGCGFADFYTFLKEKGLNIKYTGIEISENVLNIAKTKYPLLDLRLVDILEENPGEFDYVFGSGIHNVKTTDNYEHLNKILTRMFDFCKIGVATNFISADTDISKYSDHIFPYGPENIQNISRSICKYYALRHDYFAHDFTLYLYKKDWYERSIK